MYAKINGKDATTKFPMVIATSDESCIVLAHNLAGGFYEGSVISGEYDGFKPGQYSHESFDESEFNPFDGEITLSNNPI